MHWNLYLQMAELAGIVWQCTGIPVGIAPEENIIMKALSKLREGFSFPHLKLHLHKSIPIGAGLGGGSSDAACLLKALTRFFAFRQGEAAESYGPSDRKRLSLLS